MIKKILLSVTAMLALVFILLAIPSTRNMLVAQLLPKLPNLPAAVSELGAEDSGRIYFQSSSPFDLDIIFAGMQNVLQTTGVGDLSLPANATAAEPVPAIILAHGSGGIKDGREFEYAQLLNDNGIAAFVIDYYAPRGAGDDTGYLAKTASATDFDIVADVYNALTLLSTHPLIDSERVGVMGFSYGAMAARHAIGWCRINHARHRRCLQ